MSSRSRRGLVVALVVGIWTVLPTAVALADDGHHGRGHHDSQHATHDNGVRRHGWDAGADRRPDPRHCSPDGTGQAADNGHAGASGQVASEQPERAPASDGRASEQAASNQPASDQAASDQAAKRRTAWAAVIARILAAKGGKDGAARADQAAQAGPAAANQAQPPTSHAAGQAAAAPAAGAGLAVNQPPRVDATNPAGAVDATHAPAGPPSGEPAVSVATPAADTAGPGLARLVPLAAGAGLLALIGYGFAIRGRLGRFG